MTPWCYVTDEDFVDHVWIEDTDGPVCTECGLTLEMFRKETF